MIDCKVITSGRDQSWSCRRCGTYGDLTDAPECHTSKQIARRAIDEIKRILKPEKITMTHDIDRMIETVLIHEGGYVNDPDDRGGATNYGISAAACVQHLGFRPTPEQMKNLTRDAAKMIYKSQYYWRPRFDRIPDADVAAHVFDIGVNSGPRIGWKLLQRAINRAAGRDILTCDGLIGPKTQHALDHWIDSNGSIALQTQLVAVRIEFYESLVEKRPVNAKYLDGWIARAKSFTPSQGVLL